MEAGLMAATPVEERTSVATNGIAGGDRATVSGLVRTNVYNGSTNVLDITAISGSASGAGSVSSVAEEAAIPSLGIATRDSTTIASEVYTHTGVSDYWLGSM